MWGECHFGVGSTEAGGVAHGPTGASGAPLDAGGVSAEASAALAAVLTFSSSAKEHALAEGLCELWAERVHAAAEQLELAHEAQACGGSGQAKQHSRNTSSKAVSSPRTSTLCPAARGQLLSCLALLRHLAHGRSGNARARVVQTGLLGRLRRTWHLLARDPAVVVAAVQLIGTLMRSCEAARRAAAAAESGGHSLLHDIAAAATSSSTAPPLRTAANTSLAALASTPHGAALLLRTPFLPAALALLRTSWPSAADAAATGPLHALAAAAAHADAHRTLLRGTDPGLLQVLVQGAASAPGRAAGEGGGGLRGRAAALRVVRNLACGVDARPLLLGDPRVLALLLHSLADLDAATPEGLEAASHAAAALAALLHRCERAKATVKQTAGAVKAVEGCNREIRRLLQSRGAAGWHGAMRGGDSATRAHEATLAQLGEHCAAVLECLQPNTAGDVRGGRAA